MKNCIFFALFVAIIFYSDIAKAQLNISLPDSIVYYSLQAVDTSSKLPTRKEMFTYNQELGIKEKAICRWDKMKQQWIAEKKFKCVYNLKEVIVEIYAIENARQEILTARIVLKLDSNNNVTESVYYQKGRYTDRHQRLYSYENAYKNDTLIHKKYFEQGTTYFLKNERLYTFGKNVSQIIEKENHELSGTSSETLTENQFNKKLLIKSIKMDVRSHKILQVDSFNYHLDTLFSHIIKKSFSESETVSKVENDQLILYDYDISGAVKSRTSYVLNQQGIAINHHTNTFTRFYSRVVQSIQNEPLNDLIKIEDYLH